MKRGFHLLVSFAALCGCKSTITDQGLYVNVTNSQNVSGILVLRVFGSNQGKQSRVIVPDKGVGPLLSFPTSFTVIVPSDRTDEVDIAIDALDASGNIVANGTRSANLVAKAFVITTVDLAPGPPLCGNGSVDPDETCDDGNRYSGDGCDYLCQSEAPPDAASPTPQETEDGGSESGGSDDAAPSGEETGHDLALGGPAGMDGAVATGGNPGTGGIIGTGGATGTGGIVPAPAIAAFNVSPATISAGKSTSLSWTVSGAAAVSIDAGVGDVTGRTSVDVSPSSTTTYTLTVRNAAGISVTAQKTVTVVPMPTITSFKAVPPTIAAGTGAILKATFADGQALIDNGVGGISSGSPTSTGLLWSSTTYTITVTNAPGESVTAKTTVTVVAAGTFASLDAPFTTGHSATVLSDGRVLIAGGGTQTAQVYDPINGTLTPTGTMIHVRTNHSATLLASGKVLISGGWSTGTAGFPTTFLAAAELYNPETGTFAHTGAMNSPRAYHTATRLKDGSVLVAGGDGGAGALTSAEVYDPATGMFRAIANPLASARTNHTAFYLSSDKVLILGGNGPQAIEAYDPLMDSFSTVGQLATYRNQPSAVLMLYSEDILISGGAASDGTPLRSAEVYSPTTGISTPTGFMNTARQGHSGVLLENGQVLIAGGLALGVPLDSAEIYNRGTGAFSSTGKMNFARGPTTATAVSGRQVLVTGGNDQSLTAELYFY